MRLNRTYSDETDLPSEPSVFRFVMLCIPIILTLSSCRKYMGVPAPSATTPPDLTSCTRIEITYLPSTLMYFFPSSSMQRLLSPDEKNYLQTTDRIIIEDSEAIKDFAYDISRAVYEGPASRSLGIANAANVLCYRDREPLTSLFLIGGLIQTEDGHEFEFRAVKTNWRVIRPKIWSLEMRVRCGGSLLGLRSHLPGYFQDKEPYPPSEKWCDAIVRTLRAKNYSKEYIATLFSCPSIDKGKCHYAMNPNCKPNSSLDTVLFFETKAGWNQHGGPELFTFDNHDPKGGCVIDNYGTVKFIRTEEEFRQLRWE